MTEASAHGTPDAPGPSLVTSSSLLTLAGLLAMAGALVRTKVAATYIGEDGVGLVAQLTLMTTLMTSMAGLGLSVGAIRGMSLSIGEGHPDRVRNVAAFLLRLWLVAGLVLSATAAVFAPPIAELLLGDEGLDAYVVVAVLAVPLSALSLGAAAVLQGVQDLRGLAWVNGVGALAGAIVTAALVVFYGLPGAVAGIVVTWAVLLLFHVRRRSTTFRWALGPARRPDDTMLRWMAALGAASLVSGTATFLADLGVRTMIVQQLGLEANGLYQPAFLLSNQVLIVVGTSVAAYAYPRLSELVGRGDRDGLLREWGVVLRFLLGVVVVLVVVSALLHNVYVHLVFSADFSEGAPVVLWHLPGDLMRAFAIGAGIVLLVLNHVRAWLFVVLSAPLTMLVTTHLALEPLGIRAAGLAYSLGWGVNVLLTIVVLYALRLRPGERSTWRVTIGGILVVASAILVVVATPWPVAGSVLPLVAVGWIWFLYVHGDVGEVWQEMRALPLSLRALRNRANGKSR